MPSGTEMKRTRWQDYCGRLERLFLIRKANPLSINSPYVLTANRAKAIATLGEWILLPGEVMLPEETE